MARRNLLATMENMAQKRQKEFESHLHWVDQTQYYKNWERKNTQYGSWTSNDYYKNSLTEYNALKTKENKEKLLSERRNKLRKLFFEEEQNYELEMTCTARTNARQYYKQNDTATEVLKDVNLGIKLADEDRKRHEAELKLYQKWKNENPIIKNYEISENKTDLKLAWLDQQIQKRMEQEKEEKEMKKMIEEREKMIEEDKQLELLEIEENANKEKALMQDIELQIKHFKIKDEEANFLKEEEGHIFFKKQEIEDIINKNKDEKQFQRYREIAIFNINQSKLKLRKKALDIAEQLNNDQKIVQQIIDSNVADQIEDEIKRNETKRAVNEFLNFIKEQKNLESQRQKYISFIFDSEAKTMWDKQQKIWTDEQNKRNKLLEDVLTTIKAQIDFKLNQNLQKQKLLLQEREEMLQKIEDQNKTMKQTMQEAAERKMLRKTELDKQVNDAKLLEYKKKFEERMKRKEELDNIRKEEEKIRHEIMRIQTRQCPKTRFNRRIIW